MIGEIDNRESPMAHHELRMVINALGVGSSVPKNFQHFDDALVTGHGVQWVRKTNAGDSAHLLLPMDKAAQGAAFPILSYSQNDD